MKAILLAAGFGTRLQPLTLTTPKCLVLIGGKPLLKIWLEGLVAAGFNDILINTHYLSEQVTNFIKKSEFENIVTLVHEPELLGTLGTLKANQAFWQEEDVLIAHADNLCLCDWSLFVDAFDNRPSNCLATMMLFETDTPESCGIVELDEKQRVIAFHEKVAKPPSNLANAAIYIFDKSLKNQIVSLNCQGADISLHLLPCYIGEINGWLTNGYLRDIGSLKSLNKANLYIENISN